MSESLTATFQFYLQALRDRLTSQWKKEREGRAAQISAARETSEWIEERNRKLGVKPEAHQIGISPWFDRAAEGTVEPLPFEPPTQDTKAMMDPFYDMWVAGVK